MITPWLFEFFHELRDPVARHDPAAINAHFQRYLDLWTRAEARGYHGIFFSEHHFGAGYSPSPNLLVAAMASRTTTMRLGTLGVVTPYATPWRVLEEIGMLDHLTGGRLEVGMVSGIPPELALVGIDPAEAAARHAETIDIVTAALRDPVVTHHGKHWSFDDVRIVPRPLQQPPPIWTAVRSAASAARAGQLGWKICGGFLSARDMAIVFDSYRAAAGDAGHAVGPDDIAIRRLVSFVDDAADRPSGVATARRQLLATLRASAGPLPPWATLLDSPDGELEALSNEEFVAGTPAQVAEQIVEQCRVAGAGNFVVAFAATDHDELDRAHALFAAEVAPVLRAAAAPVRSARPV